jgi:hypothetical protein
MLTGTASFKQQDRDKQSAACSLLAQLLGNAPRGSVFSDFEPTPPPREPLTDTSTEGSLQQEPSISSGVEAADLEMMAPTAKQPAEGVAVKTEQKDQESNGVIASLVAKDADAHGITHDSSAAELPDVAPGVMKDPLSRSSSNEFNNVINNNIALNDNNITHGDQPSLFPPLDPETLLPATTEGAALTQDDFIPSAFLSSDIIDLPPALSDLLSYAHGPPYTDTATPIVDPDHKIKAFAKLEFDDGHFYVNTYSFILGRDVRAARAAFQREMHARDARGRRTTKNKSSSGDKSSHTPNRVKKDGSAILGSVVSDRGGIMGYDPDVPHNLRHLLSHRSSNSSHGERRQVSHTNPEQLQSNWTDYNALAAESLYDTTYDARPVDILSLVPSPYACPTIPIHPPATADGGAAGHKGISRKHVKIAYNFDKNLFEMEVMGRNGAFIGADWLATGQVRPLHSGDYIQIGGVRIRFLLPDVPAGETGADRLDEEEYAADEEAVLEDGSATGDVAELSGEDDEAQPKVTRIILKTKDPDAANSVDGDPETPQPQRRRGPGRPPKDGIMSKRERAEIAREQKLAAKREANGGPTPPSGPSRASKTINLSEDVEACSPPAKLEKRKYTKRKRPDGSIIEVPIQSIEPGELPADQILEEVTKAPVKKRKPSRSPSPDYPPESSYAPEDLAKPPYNYAVLIFDALSESPTPMTLKQIYRALKLKYPYFRFKCETEGWTSSVRHNLNGNSHLFMHAERDGKGWSWQLCLGASVEKEKKRRPSPPPTLSTQSLGPNHTQHFMPPPPVHPHPPAAETSGTQSDSHPNNLQRHQFQFTSIPPPSTNQNQALPVSVPPTRRGYPYTPTPAAQLPANNPLQGKLPPAFAQNLPIPYTSPYASNPPPQLVHLQLQRQQLNHTQHQRPQPPLQHQYHPPTPSVSQQPQHQPLAPPSTEPPRQASVHHNQHHPPPPPPPLYATHNHFRTPSNPQAPYQHVQHPPPMQSHHASHPPLPHAHSMHHHSLFHGPAGNHQHQQLPPLQPILLEEEEEEEEEEEYDDDDDESPSSFEERANKAIDDFEAVLLEDYDDKNYIRQVLKSARARVLGEAEESSFPGGEPKDEAVILDALKNLIGSLKG